MTSIDIHQRNVSAWWVLSLVDSSRWAEFRKYPFEVAQLLSTKNWFFPFTADFFPIEFSFAFMFDAQHERVAQQLELRSGKRLKWNALNYDECGWRANTFFICYLFGFFLSGVGTFTFNSILTMLFRASIQIEMVKRGDLHALSK